eukprot:TRINITY_DN1788_c0_g1_i1.p1 TRINITY_DN1788_c0_g1~~TRINITY_DN1788_c0_g1_i1.p1  ORF type:complete len:250 (+),score=39.17 TRINITY_DN1788_c0_g1_i1:225-974(+)
MFSIGFWRSVKTLSRIVASPNHKLGSFGRPCPKTLTLSTTKRHFSSSLGDGRKVIPGSLGEFTRLDLLKKETKENIEHIWNEYHKSKPVVSAVIPTETWLKMKQRSKSNTFFVFPLPREKGYISILWQILDDMFLFTSLDQYKKMGKSAVPWLTVRHYTDLSEDKGVVLMRGDPNAEVLTPLESQYLVNQLRIYLLDDIKFKRMVTFNRHPNTFNFDEVLQDMGSVGGEIENAGGSVPIGSHFNEKTEK